VVSKDLFPEAAAAFKSSGSLRKEVFRNHVLQSRHVLPPEH